MKVLVAYEMSGVVRRAFASKGHEAWSCDILPSLDGSQMHIQLPIEKIKIDEWDWDLVIAHPPCTALCVSGNSTYADSKEREEALDNIRWVMSWNVPRLCIENPVGVISSQIRKPDQYIQPWMFGHGETKKTGLWLKGLPKLQPTNIVSGREQRIWKMGPSKERSTLRSMTYEGIADAMADQWGVL